MTVVDKDMSLESVLNNRTVIPRWKSPDKAIETTLPNKHILERRQREISPWLKRLSSSYEQSPSVASANELFELAFMYGKQNEISTDVVNNSSKIRQRVSSLSQNLLQEQTKKNDIEIDESVDNTQKLSRKKIASLKKSLRNNPSIPFAWSELARHYLVVAEPEKAIKSMQGALQLAKHNRYIQRAATRLFVHLREPERALKLLRAEPLLTSDPWLLSAEIATTSDTEKNSKYIAAARRLIDSGKFNDYQTSELASAIGTVEFEHGITKKAKEHFKKSLISPTENSLAQAQWASAQDSKIIIPQEAWNTPASYEAKALAARHEGKWEETLDACALWLADEPYSIRAALLGSYFGFWPGSYARAEQFATAGLLSENNNCNGTNISLLNNRAVARAFQNRIEDAYSDFEQAIELSDGKHNAHLIATLGLIAYRSGMPELGRDCYKKSIAWFSHNKDKGSAAIASMYLLREEIKIDGEIIPFAEDMANKISKSALIAKLPELLELSNLLRQEAKSNVREEKNVYSPPTSREIFISQANKFSVPSQALVAVSDSQDPARFLSLWIQ